MCSRSIGTIVDVLGHLTIVSVTSSFSKNIPIYGLRVTYTLNTADCFTNFFYDSTHYIRLYVYYMRWGYVNGGSSYNGVETVWRNIGNNMYLTFFDDSMSVRYVNKTVKFKGIDGYRPANYKAGYIYALVDSRDMS